MKEGEGLEPSYTAGEMETGMMATWKTVCQFLKTLNTELPYDPAIPLPGGCLGEIKRFIPTKKCTEMFITTLLVIVKKRKQSICPSAEEQINKMRASHTMEYYPANKRTNCWGAWVAQLVEHPTLDLGSGHALMGGGIEPSIRLHAQWGLCLKILSSSSSAPPRNR